MIAGIAILVMGTLFIGASIIGGFNREWRLPFLTSRASSGPVAAGAAFALAWTPCVGPTLGAILGLAATSSGTIEGGFLLGVYSAGLGIPFFMTAMAFTTATQAFAVIKRHYRALEFIAGATLISMGILVLTGELFRLNIEAQKFLNGLGLDFFYNI